MPNALTVLKVVAGGTVVLLGAAGGLLYAFQTSLIYPANIPEGSRTNVATPDDYDMSYEDLTLVTPDQVRIRAYLMLQDKPESRPTVLLFHANAGNVGHRLPIAKVFYKKMHCNVLALSYRGYGLSEGSPNETGLRLDSQTALDFVLSHPALEKTRIFLYGQSIGGAVSIDLASRNTSRIHGLIVENTFRSLTLLVPNVLPFLAPFLFLLHQKWPSEDRIGAVTVPSLFLSGRRDELVPPAHMRSLFNQSTSTVKEFKEFEAGTHNDTCMQAGYFTTIAAFITNHSGLPTTPLLPTSPLPSEKPSSPASVASSTDGAGSFEMIEEEDAIDDVARGAGSTVDVEAVLVEGLRARIHRVDEKL